MGDCEEEIVPVFFQLVAIKIHAATQINSRPPTSHETLQEYIQRFTDLVMNATGTDPTTVTCKVTTVLFIRHPLNKEANYWSKNHPHSKT